jgi:hypothetical protein
MQSDWVVHDVDLMASSQPGEAGGLLTDLALAQARTQGSYARGSANSPQCGPLRVGDRDIWHIVEAMLNTSRDGETDARGVLQDFDLFSGQWLLSSL